MVQVLEQDLQNKVEAGLQPALPQQKSEGFGGKTYVIEVTLLETSVVGIPDSFDQALQDFDQGEVTDLDDAIDA